MSSLRGHLEHFGLQELLQTLSHGARTGTLQIERENEKVSIVFETGHITLVRSGSSSQIRLRSILLRGGVVSEAQLQQARQDQQQTGMLLGRALIERGVIDDDQLAQALRLKVEEELFDLFLWESGTFEFFPDLIQSTNEDEIHQVTRIQIDPMSVIIEGLRQADEWKVIRNRIPDLRWILVAVDSMPAPAESHSIFKLVDGQRSIDEVLGMATTTRFDTCSILYRFIEEGRVREATHGELLTQARNISAQRPAAALSFYETLIDRAGASVGHSLLEEAAECAAHNDPTAQASFIRRASEILKRDGDCAGAWARVQRLLVLEPGNVEDLQQAWSLRKHAPARRQLTLLDDLTRTLRRAGEYRQVATVLREAEQLRSKEALYWLQLGTALQRSKDPGAEDCLVRAIKQSGVKEPDVALRAEKLLRSINSDLAMGEEDVEDLRERRVSIESRKRLRKNVFVSAVCLILMLLVFQVSSEWRARGLLAAARSIEITTQGLNGMMDAVLAYERVAEEHPWTLAGATGSDSGMRLRNQMEEQRSLEQSARSEALQMQRELRQQNLTRVRDSIAEAKDLRKQEQVTAARNILDNLDPELLKVLPEIELNSITYPVVIQSRPVGARVLDSKQNFVGITPVVVDLHHNSKRSYLVERSGCRSKNIELSHLSAAQVEVSLVRGPLRTYTLPDTVNNAALAGDSLVLAGRDGQVRVVDVQKLSSIGEHVVGVEGHPAPILVEQKGKVLAIPYAGRPVLIDTDGDARPFGPSARAPWSAACTLQGGWVLADVDGEITHIDSRGKTRWKYQCNSPVLLVATTAAGSLYAVDQSRFQHHIDTRGRIVEDAIRLPGDAVHLLPDGRALLHDGTLWNGSSKQNDTTVRVSAPSTATRQYGPQGIYGTSSGWVELSETTSTEYDSEVAPSCTPLKGEEGGTTWIAGVDGILRLHDSAGKIVSEIELGSVAVDLQRSRQGRILVTLADGRLCDVEALSR